MALYERGTLNEQLKHLTQPPVVHIGHGQVQAVLVPLYQLLGGAEATDGWRTIDAAAAVPPGLGMVAVDGDDAAAAQQIIRLGLLGRLTGKTLMVFVSSDARTPDRPLRGLLNAELVDNVVIAARSSAPALRRAIREAVSHGQPMLARLIPAPGDPAPVVIMGGR